MMRQHPIHPSEDPFAERPDAKVKRPPGRFRTWLAKSSPGTVLVAVAFCLLIIALTVQSVVGYYERKAEREEGRSELTCRSEFTNDVTQAEGQSLLAIERLVIANVQDDPKAVQKYVDELVATAPEFERALRNREVAEEICAGRPAS